MPLLWKKEKIGRISGFISDLRSRRRRSSLPVQTGFPTSLADLIVKNRTRLKKPSSKKKISSGDRSPSIASASPPSPISNFSEDPVFELPRKEIPRSKIGRELRELEFSYSDSEELSPSGCEEFKDDGVSTPRRFSAILKVFFVVIVALATKEIVVGITVSAFLLFFLEFVGKRLSFSSRPCAGGFDLSYGVRVCDKVDVIRVNGSDSGSFDCVRRLAFARDDGDLVEFDNFVNRKVCWSKEIQVIESDLDLFVHEKRLEWNREILAVDGDGDLIKDKKVRKWKQGNVIFKEKFLKKFVPKKFRGRKSRKVSKEEVPDSSSEASEFRAVHEEEEEEEEEEDEGGGGGGEDGQEDEDEVVFSSVSSDEIQMFNLEEMVETKENTCIEIKWNTGHLVFFVIVLFGLVRGRVMALLLTFAWFLLVKSLGTAWRNFKKMYESGTLL